LKFETEQNLWILPKIFQKNVVTTSKLFFSNFWHLTDLFWLLYTYKYNREKTRWITEILLSHILAKFKVSSQ